jgi:hypothetical protein
VPRSKPREGHGSNFKHERVVSEYSDFARSFTKMRSTDIRARIDEQYASDRFWPEPILLDALVAHGVDRPDDIRDSLNGQTLIWRKLYIALAPDDEEAALKKKSFEVVVYAPGDGVDLAALAGRDATSATTRLRPSVDPSLAMVAEVPMHWSWPLGVNRSRRRRTSMATSAPYRPR